MTLSKILKLCLSLYSLCFILPDARAEVLAKFSPSDDIHSLLLQDLRQSLDRVDIAMYSLSDSGTIAQLKALASAGTRIRVILDRAGNKASLVADLEQAGVDVRTMSLTMHHKFALLYPIAEETPVSEPLLITGSGNWSVSGMRLYDEDFLWFKEEPEYTRPFRFEFENLWNFSRPIGHERFAPVPDPQWLQDGLNQPVLFTSSNLEPRLRHNGWGFSERAGIGGGVAGTTVISAIDAATREVFIATTHFRRRDIYEALNRAMLRGVAVSLVLDAQEYHRLVSRSQGMRDQRQRFFDEILGLDGAEVRYKFNMPYWDYKYARQMHAKFMIVDGSLVLTGSFNWSENSELNGFENLLTLKNPDAIAAYRERFEAIFQYGSGTLPALLETIKSQNGTGPCQFQVVALTAGEVAELRRTYSAEACRPE